MRIIHPMLAIGVGLYVVGMAWAAVRRRPGRRAELLATVLTGLFLLQLAIGALNVVLLAPVWMQLVHLLMADLVWITLVLLAAAVLAWPAAATEPTVIQPQRAQRAQRV
jgi:heme A synthase